VFPPLPVVGVPSCSLLSPLLNPFPFFPFLIFISDNKRKLDHSSKNFDEILRGEKKRKLDKNIWVPTSQDLDSLVQNLTPV
jgi:hypothetical protein